MEMYSEKFCLIVGPENMGLAIVIVDVTLEL